MEPGDGSADPGRAEYDVDEVDSLTFARRYGDARHGFTVYRSTFADPWGFDYEVTDLQGRPRELIWVESGMMTAHSGPRRWTLSPETAIWIPAGTASEVIPNLPSRAFCVQFDAAHPHLEPTVPTLFRVTSLARELLLRLGTPGFDSDGALLARDLVLRELEPMETALHMLTLPTDRRVRRVAADLLADPADRRTLDELAAAAFCSPKTLQRAFRAETGLSFSAWRRTARVLSSLPLLESGLPVVATAPRVGFSDPGAYIDAFRAHFGCTPGRYAGSSNN